MMPQTAAGTILITQIAWLSVRMERAAEQETAATAMRVRHAAEGFDEERIEAAERLFGTLDENPRQVLRQLMRSPEGVERLIDAWTELRADLAIDPEPEWTAEQLERAANLMGLKARHARGSRLGALSRAYWGDFAALGDGDGAGLDDIFRKAWAREQLFEQIDAEIAGLEAHYETLDFETLAIDRAEAGARALFDDSKSAGLARRYESEARRGFFRALKEFRQIEAEFAAQAESTPTPPPSTGTKVGSFRQNAAPRDPKPTRTDLDAPIASDSPLPGPDGRPLTYVPPVKKPG
jgi:hypothetical protein